MTSHHDNTEHNDYHFRAKKKEINKQQPFESSMTRTSIGDFDLSKYASWKKRWTHWFCNSERLPATEIMQKLTPTVPKSNNLTGTISKTSSHHPQPNDRVNQSNTESSRDRARRYSNPFVSIGRAEDGEQYSNRSVFQSKREENHQQSSSLSRSADRINNRHKSFRRELRYEEHNDYIPLAPPSTSLNSIQCQPTVDHYARNLNQSSHYSSTHRRSQIEIYQPSNSKNRTRISRPHSSNIPLSSNKYTAIPITFISDERVQTPIMTKQIVDNEDTYGRLSECHSPLAPLENSAVKPPRRIESAYSQFPTLTSSTPTLQEPIYANTQSLYDNILYPNSSKTGVRIDRTMVESNADKKSCASQTQLTWTMATFSSFVDLENSSIIIPQTDPATLISLPPNYQTQTGNSPSPTMIEHNKRLSPTSPHREEIRPRSSTPTSAKFLMIEKREGGFQTLLTISPAQEIGSGKQLFIPDSTPSPFSTGSSSVTTDQQQQSQQHQTQSHHHHHRHHRRHKSRSRSSRQGTSTRDVGLQVNIQTVKKIIFSNEKSEETSLATSPSQTTVVPTRELRSVQTNTETVVSKKQDRSTSYENNLHLVSSSSQTLDSTATNVILQTNAAQTSIKSSRDQSIETNNHGLFVCDLSSLLKSNLDEIPASSTITTNSMIKRKA